MREEGREGGGVSPRTEGKSGERGENFDDGEAKKRGVEKLLHTKVRCIEGGGSGGFTAQSCGAIFGGGGGGGDDDGGGGGGCNEKCQMSDKLSRLDREIRQHVKGKRLMLFYVLQNYIRVE